MQKRMFVDMPRNHVFFSMMYVIFFLHITRTLHLLMRESK